jgi:hypothetical protein
MGASQDDELSDTSDTSEINEGAEEERPSSDKSGIEPIENLTNPVENREVSAKNLEEEEVLMNQTAMQTEANTIDLATKNVVSDSDTARTADPEILNQITAEAKKSVLQETTSSNLRDATEDGPPGPAEDVQKGTQTTAQPKGIFRESTKEFPERRRRPSDSGGNRPPTRYGARVIKPEIIIEFGKKKSSKEYPAASNHKRSSLGTASTNPDEVATESPGAEASYTIRTGFPQATIIVDTSEDAKDDSHTKPRRPRHRSGEIVDWPSPPTEVNSSGNVDRGSLYEKDLELQQRNAKRYSVEVREPSPRHVREHHLPGYYR